jgi:hypothetical protein
MNLANLPATVATFAVVAFTVAVFAVACSPQSNRK